MKTPNRCVVAIVILLAALGLETTVHVYQRRELRNVRDQVRELCGDVGLDLDVAVQEWRTWSALPDVQKLNESKRTYSRSLVERQQIAAMCLGSIEAAKACVPNDLNSESLAEVMHAAEALENGRACR